MKLWAKIGVLMSAILAGCIIAVLVFSHRSAAAALLAEQDRVLLLTAERLAQELKEPLREGQRDALPGMLRGLQERNGGIAYLFVKNSTGSVAAHTFSRSVPEDALHAAVLRGGGQRSVARLPGGEWYQAGVPVETGAGDELFIGEPGQARNAALHALWGRELAAGTLAIAFGSLLCFSVVYRLTRPLQTVVQGIQIIGQGDLDHRLPAGGRDEIGGLAREINDMAERRKTTEDMIMKLNFELEENVEQRTAQLTAANRELEAFAYSVSHDLRAPLRSIDGFSKALLDDYLDKLDAEGRDHLKRIRKASQRMGQLIDDLLKLSRLTRGDMLIEQVDLSAMAREIAGNLQAADPARPVRVTVQDGVTGAGDRKMLRVVLENLLGNAWKYTTKQPQPRILFGMAGNGPSRAFFIKDNGAGFDMHYVQKLFGVFQRLHSDAEFPGTGIGLATVQRIVHRHGGTVWAEGEVGKGATFYFTLGRAA